MPLGDALQRRSPARLYRNRIQVATSGILLKRLNGQAWSADFGHHLAHRAWLDKPHIHQEPLAMGRGLQFGPHRDSRLLKTLKLEAGAGQ